MSQGMISSVCWNAPPQQRHVPRGELPRKDAALTGLGIQRCPGSLAEARAGADGVLACRRCVLVEEMCHHIEVSLKEVS